MKLHFRKYGEGLPLFILHGLFGTADNWNTLAKSYAEHFCTYIIDQRNHGQSPHSDIWNYEVMTEDLVELMIDEGLSSIHLMGHSMGGKTAMFMACKYPEKVRKLIVSDIAPRYYPVHHTEIIDALRAVPLSSIQSRKEAESILEKHIHDFAIRQFLLKNLYWKDDRLAWRFNLDVISRNIEEVGRKLPETYRYAGPTLFIRGSKSDYIIPADEPMIKNHFPQSNIVTIEDCGHWIHAEKPKEYLAETLKFLMSY
ncbi:MAG: alpha/beta fold hydrolase [Flavobacteriales bacterium]|nr:alpha/beta fold hydrolase [Flavobacteriales bacterium]